MLRFLAYLLASLFLLSAAHARQSSATPGQQFERTRHLAAPPINISAPAIYLPEVIPVREEPQEPQTTPRAPIRATRRTMRSGT
ncbi:uncharacterized protein LOC128867932 isoform X2 [Anastrepha ludens]|uniref:uncharacterized protein LOC128867932 isoform X2 n=1 Tax=Anastrepha ludens TaxID=28586 RepID=UPI0023B12D45|nr:uncharacterized protein LOC128867932 isoform X2 [Anastrepha ludens]